MSDLTRAASAFAPSTARALRRPRPRRARLLPVVSGVAVSAAAVVMLLTAGLTLFSARPLYRRMARIVAVGILRLHGIRIRVHHASALARRQTVYVSNHTSTLDLFILVGLGLPDCRFFLSGFLRKVVPLGIISWLLGTFFTVPQDRPRERTRIFQRAERVLRRTGESVYLSPEGGRITTGAIGHFNKGAFHLATNLRARIVPFYIRIPPEVDPGLAFDARPGVVDVFFLPPVDTGDWSLADLDDNTASIRRLMTAAHEELTCRP